MIPDDFEAITAALAKADHSEVLRLALEFDDKGRYAEAALGRLLAANQAHDPEVVTKIAVSRAGDLLRSAPINRFILAKSIASTRGIQAAAEEFGALSGAAGNLEEKYFLEVREQCEFNRLLGYTPANRIIGKTAGDESILRKDNLVYIKVSVNNTEPEYFILDTGAPSTVVSRKFSGKFKIGYNENIYKLSRSGAGDYVRLFPAVLESMSVSGVGFRNCPVHVMDLPEELGVAGIFSPLWTLQGIPFKIDFRNNRIQLNLTNPAARWEDTVEGNVWNIKLIWNDDNIFVPAEIVGFGSGFFLFDTGAGANIVCSSFVKDHTIINMDNQVVESYTASGKVDVLKGMAGELSVGGSPAVSTDLMVKECLRDNLSLFPLNMSGYIGVPWFDSRLVYFPKDGKTVYFTAIN